MERLGGQKQATQQGLCHDKKKTPSVCGRTNLFLLLSYDRQKEGAKGDSNDVTQEENQNTWESDMKAYTYTNANRLNPRWTNSITL